MQGFQKIGGAPLGGARLLFGKPAQLSFNISALNCIVVNIKTRGEHKCSFSTAARSREELVRGLLLLSWSGKKKELVERVW